jgi:hypothetical protein
MVAQQFTPNIYDLKIVICGTYAYSQIDSIIIYLSKKKVYLFIVDIFLNA